MKNDDRLVFNVVKMADADGHAVKRCPNFSSKEVELLVSLVKKYSSVIECKKTDSATWREKEEAWEKLSVDFNSCSGGVVRSAKNLNMKYQNIKKTSKKKFAEEKQELYKTGGGKPSVINITPVDNIIKDITGKTSTGLEAVYDSDDVTSRPIAADKWGTWNPVMLREPVSTALLADVDIEEVTTVEAEENVTAGK